MPQGRRFRRHIQPASPLVLYSEKGWMLTDAAWLSFGANAFLDSIAYGIVAGPGLVGLSILGHQTERSRGSIEVAVITLLTREKQSKQSRFVCHAIGKPYHERRPPFCFPP